MQLQDYHLQRRPWRCSAGGRSMTSRTQTPSSCENKPAELLCYILRLTCRCQVQTCEGKSGKTGLGVTSGWREQSYPAKRQSNHPLRWKNPQVKCALLTNPLLFGFTWELAEGEFALPRSFKNMKYEAAMTCSMAPPSQPCYPALQKHSVPRGFLITHNSISDTQKGTEK